MTLTFGSDGGILRRPAQLTSRYTLFLSSGSDLASERDAFCELVRTFNDQMFLAPWTSIPIDLHVVRWEQDISRRMVPGDGNKQFREMAENSHSVVVLLHNDIRPGTKDELEAALEVQDVQIHVLLMKPASRRKPATVALRNYLETKKHEIHWNETGSPGTLESWLAMTRILVRLVGEISRTDVAMDDVRSEPFNEKY